MDEVEEDELLVAFPSKPTSLINCSRDKSLNDDMSLTSVVYLTYAAYAYYGVYNEMMMMQEEMWCLMSKKI